MDAPRRKRRAREWRVRRRNTFRFVSAAQARRRPPLQDSSFTSKSRLFAGGTNGEERMHHNKCGSHPARNDREAAENGGVDERCTSLLSLPYPFPHHYACVLTPYPGGHTMPLDRSHPFCAHTAM